MAAKKKAKVKGNESLSRDLFSKAIINTDRSSYTSYRNRKNILRQKENRLKTLEDEVKELRMIVSTLLNK